MGHMAGNLCKPPVLSTFILLGILGLEHRKMTQGLASRQPERQPDTLSVSASQSDSTKGCFTKRLLFQACVSFA